MRGAPRSMWLLTLLHVLVMVAYSMLFASFRAPDEPQHVDLARAVATDGRYPRYDERHLSTQVVAALPVVHFDQRSTHLTAEEAPARSTRPSFSELGPDAPHATERNQLPSHPPLYYLVAGGLLRAAPDGLPFDQEVGLLRLLGVLLLAPLPILAWLTARRLDWPPGAGVAAAAFPLTIPQLAHVGASVSNDNLLTLLVGVATLLAVRVATGDRRTRTAVLLGLVSGLAMLTKAFALFLPVVVVVAYLVQMRSGRSDRREATRHVAIAGALSLVVGGWWWVRNVVVFHQLQTGIKLLPPGDAVPGHGARWWLGRYLSFMASRFWGWFGWFDVRLPAVVAVVATTVVLGLVAVAAWHSRGRDLRAAFAILVAPLLAILLMVGLGAYQGFVRTARDEGLQGRYLFPAVTGLAALVGLGVTVLCRRRHGLAPLVVLAGAGGMHAVALARILGFYWGGPGAHLFDRLLAVSAWSPWPPPVAIVTTVGVVVVGALTVITLVDDLEVGAARRRRRGPSFRA